MVRAELTILRRRLHVISTKIGGLEMDALRGSGDWTGRGGVVSYRPGRYVVQKDLRGGWDDSWIGKPF
jgi:hypothetical protein